MTALPAFGIPHSHFRIPHFLYDWRQIPTSNFKIPFSEFQLPNSFLFPIPLSKVPLQLARWRQQVKDSRNLFDTTQM